MSPLTRILTLALLAVLALQAVNAQGTSDRKYLIVPASSTSPPPFPIGANYAQEPTSPVVVGGSNTGWNIKRSGGEEYLISLEENEPRGFTQVKDNEVVVSAMPPAATWRVQKREGDTYSIEVVSNIFPTRTWTLASTVPGTKVTLEFFEIYPRPNQLWRIIPIVE
ncbi:MAG: hypothetical protein J3R72DRAFT_12750 [Linnemannia gamsii]|nr:MAG: hypothetical protein J3R72DRAFT_12712 [Linnemannia gamsii]KAK3826777.1 MAG: hypothetical protein J3R72DRAFT_12750 [Linnemannia gamsii]